ncbi:MAG: hypothetical protein JW934_11340 [Anaerolineae bacterium]|nr:hypothetical protein [Anaerolineae bacterium]
MRNALSKLSRWLPLLLILGAAAFLRLYRLDELPRGPYYDEAANVILAGEIAHGQSFPLFIRSYTGKEVFFFYTAAGLMKLFGMSTWTLRFTSALIGVATTLLTFWLAWTLFDREEERTRYGVALLAAAIIGTNFWHLSISRYGFRAISQPVMQALTLIFLWKGVRDAAPRYTWRHILLGGFFCGLTAYTYLSGRIVPLALIPWVVGLWLAAKGQRRQAALRSAVFGLVALIVAAPLLVFFLRNPDAFGARMSQVSVFNPELNQGDLWRALWGSVKAALGMFTVRGDPQARFGVIGRPVFDPLLGAFFYLGVLAMLYKAIRGPHAADRVLGVSTLLWVPLLLVPSILGVKEVPHSLRAIGVMPILFLFPALGLMTMVKRVGTRWKQTPSPLVWTALAALILVGEGIYTGWDYFVVWGGQAQTYYENDNDMADAARALNGIDMGEREIWVSSIHYRHPTMALLARDYPRIRWLVGGQVLALPPPDGAGAVYAFPHSALPDPALLALLDTVAVPQRHLGPDGDTAFLIYELPPGAAPEIAPQYEVSANFGGQIELIGYDLPPVRAGETLKATLYWRVLASNPAQADDFLAFAHLGDQWDWHWGGADPFDYPSSEWSPGQIVVQQREIAVPAVAPPGDYSLLIGLASRGQNARLPLLDAQGRLAGTTVRIGPAYVESAAPPVEPPAVPKPFDVDYDGLTLLGIRHDRSNLTSLTDLRPGDTLYIGLYWQSSRALPDLDFTLRLTPVDGDEAVELWQGRPVHDTYPTTQWSPGTTLLDPYSLRIPTDAPSGPYTLTLSVRNVDQDVPVSGPLALIAVQIAQVDRRTIVPPIEHPLQANLGDQIELLGYDLDRTEAKPGDTLHLILYWRATSEMETSYTVFTHLLDGGEQIRGQQDNPPQRGTYPTTLWMPGEVVVDEYDLVVKADAAAGTHVIEIGMYDPADLRRLPILDATGVIGDRILLGEVEVVLE